jgi:aspartate/methionine/tyrosine aminotransferase
MSPAARPGLAERTVVVRSFSKMYAMGPWRLGFAVGPAEIIAAMAKLLQWSVIAVDSVGQAAALAALTGPQQWVADTMAELAERRVQVLRALNASEILEAALPQAGAVLWARIMDPGWNEAELSLVLGREFGIPAVRGSLFGAAEPHLRIPFGGERDAIRDLVQRLPRVPPATQSDLA